MRQPVIDDPFSPKLDFLFLNISGSTAVWRQLRSLFLADTAIFLEFIVIGCYRGAYNGHDREAHKKDESSELHNALGRSVV